MKNFYLNNRQQVIIAHVNINSVRHKFLPLCDVLKNNFLDVLFIQETKLDDSFPMAQFYIPGFKMYRNDHKNNSGGIMCYINDEIAPQRRTDIVVNENVSGRIESLAVEITIKKEKWILYSVYKQPLLKRPLI